VATVHDLAVIQDPSHFTERGVRTMTAGVRILLDEAALVMCSSMATLADCVDYGFERSRLRHVPLGVRPVAVTDDDVLETRRHHGLSRPYVLAVGTVEPRKNLARLARAFAELPADYELVVVGPLGWGSDAAPVGLTEEVARRIRMIGVVEEKTRRCSAIRVCARVSVCPSSKRCRPAFR
jgi:glycosyltransferase involved in cell wall biosynthesis